MLRPMKIIVTGGAGFIGSHLVDAYITAGHTVSVIDNFSHGFRRNLNPQAKLYRCDIRNLSKLRSIIRRERPDIINHHAAISEVVVSMREPNDTLTVNVSGTANILQCAVLTGVKKIIFASTGGTIYGNAKKIPTPETAPLEPVSVYAASKQLAEAWIQYYQCAFGIDYTIFRYGNVFGPRQDPHGEAGVVTIFCQQLTKKQPVTIFGDGTKTRDYVYVADVVRANQLALRRGRNCIVNLGCGVEISDQQVYTTIAQYFPLAKPPRSAPVRPGEVIHSSIAIHQAWRHLRWKPHYSFTQGVNAYITTLQ